MNEIESKRKELEWDVIHFSGDNTEVCSKRDITENIFEGFNLGVEMAQKEFLGKIDNCYYKSHKNTEAGQCGNRVVEMKILNKLKQSLEEKNPK